MEIHSVDHIELYVEDAEKASNELCESFGFTVHGRGGPDTGLEGRTSVLLRQHDIALVVTSAIGDGHRAAEYVRRHGDGIAVVGLSVDDACAAFAEAVARGAVPTAEPEAFGEVVFASVEGFGDVEHRFTSRPAGAPFAPGIIEQVAGASSAGLLKSVDHLAVCVPAGELGETVRRYREIFDFDQTFEERIIVGSQAMDSKVVQSASGKVTLTIIEPDTTRARGQIDEFVGSHGGAGVQHIAFLTEDITVAVRAGTGNGVRFLTTPPSYYEDLPSRLGSVGFPVETLQELNILADRDHSGVMLQIFTESRHARRTLFYELIDRRGARTFGSNNIKALYEAVERQQAADRAGLT
ncbi:4-hydroxyphenylpyruvate dioxygenase [Actinomadura sp. DC4]|uniref:4-hydroxyphenylpyruvate dioxygenase n=1 Tax=Actinomadura sp. DC4 TaxID=3055069 RepID=UPI0025AFB668|nr:4-hydroxyphenylpyruvate dioxygenase [Actinomadura sp. DC4]MDN3358641.1 4-hydroxyphenylpyruvate dioxygenase [Actinomadura sp. DC4]